MYSSPPPLMMVTMQSGRCYYTHTVFAYRISRNASPAWDLNIWAQPLRATPYTVLYARPAKLLCQLQPLILVETMPVIRLDTACARDVRVTLNYLMHATSISAFMLVRWPRVSHWVSISIWFPAWSSPRKKGLLSPHNTRHEMWWWLLYGMAVSFPRFLYSCKMICWPQATYSMPPAHYFSPASSIPPTWWRI